MLRKIIWLLAALILSSCTLAPERTPTPAVIATQAPCPTCAAAATCAPTGTTQPTIAAVLPQAVTSSPTPKPSRTATATRVRPTKKPTATATRVPPTRTATTTASVTATAVPPTLTATATAVPPTPTFTPVPPTFTPTALPVPYMVQGGTPRLGKNFAHPDLGCHWMGVAGQVFDMDLQPLKNVVVVVTGALNGAAVNELGLTGSAPAYGPGGYEVKLADQALASETSLFIQLYDLDGNPLSYPVAFDTQANCAKNLVVVNFVQH